MYESPYSKQETEDLIEQINELRDLLAACWRMVPDGYGGAAMSKIKRGMTKYDCWPEHDDCPRRQDALTRSRGFSTSLQNKE